MHAFVRMGDAPMLQTGKDTVSILPVDYLFWSPPLEGLVGLPRRPNVDHRTSEHARKVSAPSRGWTIVPKAGAQLGQ